MNLPRVGVVCDLREENWPSMDLVGEMLLTHLQRDHADSFSSTRLCPPMRRRLTSQRSEIRGQKSEVGGQSSEVGGQKSEARGRRFNADRFLNRFWDYPRVARQRRDEFDLFHLVDHSYGQLVHQLPPDRTVITCHDRDTFRCLLVTNGDRRCWLFKAMMKRTLSGFSKAARVVCDSRATYDELLAHDLVSPGRLSVVPLGVHPAFSAAPNAVADAEAARLLNLNGAETIDILHVGSTIKRKRVDVLLRVLAEVRKQFPRTRLIRVGGAFTAQQQLLSQRLNLRGSIVLQPHLDRGVLAAVSRRAALVLLPSEREGFGLPVIEAMACGTPVVASDLPVLHEVGGEAASYCPVADVNTWRDTVCALLTERNKSPERWAARREQGIQNAARFSWAEYARKMVGIYREVLSS